MEEKSFRQISRETGITTPTVKARFETLVNIGFIKGVLPVFDFNKVNYTEVVLKYKILIKTMQHERKSILIQVMIIVTNLKKK
jgi:Lrp/AsnC family leucine-responsive transcriptional regulator